MTPFERQQYDAKQAREQHRWGQPGGPYRSNRSDESVLFCANGYQYIVPNPRASQVASQVIDTQGNGIRC